MKPADLALATGMPGNLAEVWAPALTRAMKEFGITTPKRQAQFLAQTGHESAGFTRLAENLNYSAQGLANTWPARFGTNGGPNAQALQIQRQPELIADAVYDGRLGNDAEGDGYRYRGRGAIQLTGKANYAAAGKALELDLVGDPDQALEPEVGARIAAWFWSKNNLNDLADAGDTRGVTRKINGGTIGLADREARYAKALKVLTA